MKRKSVIIIGAGIGGLAIAIQLAMKGMKVTVYEKNEKPGGRCQRIKEGGYIFDSGPTMYLFPQIYEDFFKSINEDINDYITLKRSDPIYRLNFPDGKHLLLTNNLSKMEKQLEEFEPGSYKKFLKYLDLGGKHFDLAINKIAGNSLANPVEYFNPKNVYSILGTSAITNHYSYTRKFFKHPDLNIAFSFQDSYLSLSPYEAPAIYSLFPYSEFMHGNYLPKGGMYSIILALTKIAKKHGVEIICNSPVKKIIVKDGKAIGIKMNNLVKKADYVVVNADLSYAYRSLLPDDPFVGKLKKKKYSCSAIVFHWGMRKVYPQLATHNLFFSDPFEEGFQKVLQGHEPPGDPHFYLQAPCRTDPTRAPKGEDTLTVVIPINHIDSFHPIDWEEYKNKVREYVISRLKNEGLRGFERNIKFEVSYLPSDWQSYFNLTNGSVYGLHHNFGQVGYFRPRRQHEKYKNLFFVGASTHPGSGLPTVLMSSQYTSQRILQQAE